MVTTSPGASVRGSLLVSGKQSLLPQIRLPDRSNSCSSSRPLSSARTQGTAETLATSRSKVGLLPTAALPGVRTSRPIMSSVHGPPATGPGAAGAAAAAAVGGAGGGGGVAAGVGDGPPRPSAGA